jgi:hypothetical protein
VCRGAGVCLLQRLEHVRPVLGLHGAEQPPRILDHRLRFDAQHLRHAGADEVDAGECGARDPLELVDRARKPVGHFPQPPLGAGHGFFGALPLVDVRVGAGHADGAALGRALRHHPVRVNPLPRARRGADPVLDRVFGCRALERRERRHGDALEVVGVHQCLQRRDLDHAAAAILAEDVGPVVAQEHAARRDFEIPQREPGTTQRQVEPRFAFTSHRLETAANHHLAVELGGAMCHFSGHRHAKAGLGDDEQSGEEHQHHSPGQEQPPLGRLARQQVGARRRHVESPDSAAEGDGQRDTQAGTAGGRTALPQDRNLLAQRRDVAQVHREPKGRGLSRQLVRHMVHRHDAAGITADARAPLGHGGWRRCVGGLGVHRHHQDDAGRSGTPRRKR